MANLPGWKDILRPIRDGYRHLFPSPDTGPTPEERRKQRETDRLKGFTYFDTFEQLETWSEAESDPIQRANTPLLRRRRVSKEDGPAKANVLLIHDYAGNYHNYESVQETGVEDEMYACEYLQFVDAFVYFSHKLMCIPPPTWTNTLHRNGVMALGTILIEPQTEGSEKLLQHTNDGSGIVFPIANKLGDIAQHYGFDGWLLNVEKPFPGAEWNLNTLELFLRHLRSASGIGTRLIWYDALTTSNRISYQNALNNSNVAFANDCGNMLTNYCWTEADAEKSRQVALSNKIPPQEIFFGIDVWAQNTSKLNHPRVTYPEKGGGGTNTGVAVTELASLGFSAGIFAPAWSFEHFPGHGRAVERAIWEGTTLPEDFECSCGTSRHQPNPETPIIRSAGEYAAGSETFFYTDFSRAFSKHGVENKDAVFGGQSIHAQLGAQSILPRPRTPKGGNPTLDFSYQLADPAGKTQLMIQTQRRPPKVERLEHWLTLYKLEMSMSEPLHFTASCRHLLDSSKNAMVSFYLSCTSTFQLLPIPQGDGIQSVHLTLGMGSGMRPNARLLELGIYLRGSIGSIGEAVKILEVLEICILPPSTLQPLHSYGISNIRVESRGDGGQAHVRLCWTFDSGRNDAESSMEGMPYSGITGPFSYFDIQLDELRLGRAYALEHPLLETLVERFKGREVEVEITGVGFDGGKLAESKVQLRI